MKKLVTGEGFEPPSLAYETNMLPLHYCAMLERCNRFKLSPSDWKSDMLITNTNNANK